MVSNIDFLRKASGDENRNRRKEVKTEPSSHIESIAAEQTDTSATVDSSEIGGILGRIMDHIETTDRRHSETLNSLTSRLDQLTDQVAFKTSRDEHTESEETTDFQSQMSSLSQHISDTRESEPAVSAREIFEQKLAQLSAKLEQSDTGGKETANQTIGTEEETQTATSLAKLGELHDELSETDSSPDNRNFSPSIGKQKSGKQVSYKSQPNHEQAQQRPFDDEISAESLGHETIGHDPISKPETRNSTVRETTAIGHNTFETYNSEEDAMAALAIGFESQDLTEVTSTKHMPVEQTPAQAPGIPGSQELGARLDTLVTKFEDAISERNTEPLIRTIEAQISELPAYFGREEHRQQRLEQIESNISTLTAMIQDTRAAISELSERIAEETATHVVNKMETGPSATKLAAIDEYLSNLKVAEKQKETNTSETVEAVYGALEQMLDRLESIEQTPRQSFASTQDSGFTPSNANLTDYSQTGITAAKPASPAMSPTHEPVQSEEHPTQPEEFLEAQPRHVSLSEQPRDDDFIDEDDGSQLVDRQSDISDDEDELVEEHDFGAHRGRASNRSSANAQERWDRQVPPYIGTNQMRDGRQGQPHWTKRNRTAIVAAVMVFLSAGGGLLVSQLSLRDGDVGSNSKIAMNQTDRGSEPVKADTRNTGTLAQPEVELWAANNQQNNDSVESAQLTRYAPPNIEKTTDYGQSASPQKAVEQLPGVAIGQVSDPGIRHQLQQSMRHQKLAEISGKTVSAGNPALPAPNHNTGDPTQTAAVPPQTAMVNTPQQTSGPQSQLPASIGDGSLRVAAANGDPKAEYEIGARYARGSGVTQNLSEAVNWFNKSASTGFAPAQYRLATHYERGAGVQKDLERAKIWYRRAADSGNVKAMHNYAVLHTGREGVKPDYALAATWFRKAANHGLSDSQFNLAVLHENGLGTNKDVVQAYKWLTLASLSGDREAGKRREILRKQLEPYAIAIAEKEALDWKPEPASPTANAEKISMLGQGSTQVASQSPAPAVNAAPTKIPTPSRAPLAETKTVAAKIQPQKQADPLIKKAQELLSNLGYDTGPADGHSGPKTRSAISAFQRRAGMPETGNVSRELIQRLASLSI